MSTEMARHYFYEIKRIWKPFEPAARARGMYIIPFCTPIVMNPPALVIGRNHTEFVPHNASDARRIAEMYSRDVPTVNTYTQHNHAFAVGLRQICERAAIELTEQWVGTNRCAVQWEKGGGKLEEVTSVGANGFAQCECEMDALLESLVGKIRPRNVILAGKYACGLCFANADNRRYDELEPFDWHGSRIIGIESPTSHFFWPQAAERLMEYFVQ